MQIVIDIPDRIYNMVQNKTLNIIDSEIVEKAVKNGTPLPERYEYADGYEDGYEDDMQRVMQRAMVHGRKENIK